MASKADRLLAQLDDTDAARLLAAELGARCDGQGVDLIVRALRVARRQGRADEATARKQRHRNRPRRDDEWVADAASSMVKSLAQRSAYTMETLAALRQHYDDGPAMMGLAVAGARAQGYSDAEIGRALGVTSEAIGQRYGRRHAAAADRSSASRSA